MAAQPARQPGDPREPPTSGFTRPTLVVIRVPQNRREGTLGRPACEGPAPGPAQQVPFSQLRQLPLPAGDLCCLVRETGGDVSKSMKQRTHGNSGVHGISSPWECVNLPKDTHRPFPRRRTDSCVYVVTRVRAHTASGHMHVPRAPRARQMQSARPEPAPGLRGQMSTLSNSWEPEPRWVSTLPT